MLDIYLHDGPRSVKFKLLGTVTRPWTAELEQTWKTASSIRNGKQLVVDLTGIVNIDEEGERLLDLLSRDGARFISASPGSDAVAERISHRSPAVLPPLPVRGWHKVLCWLRQCCHGAQGSFDDRVPCSTVTRKLW